MSKRSREAIYPDITPLIDVVFLLLIFFMTSTVFKKDELALLLNLPQAEEGDGTSKEKEGISIELSAQELAFNGKKMQMEDLDNELATIEKKSIPVDLRIDREVKYDLVVRLLDKLKRFKLSNISLITDS